MSNSIELRFSRDQGIENIKADVLLLKNISEGVFGVEKYVDSLVDGKLRSYNKPQFCSPGMVISVPFNSGIVKSENIVLAGMGNTPGVSISIIEEFYFQSFKYLLEAKIKTDMGLTILTVCHGVGFGIEKKEVFFAIIRALRRMAANYEVVHGIKEIIINETGLSGVPALEKIFREARLLNPGLFVEMENRFYVDFDSFYYRAKSSIEIHTAFMGDKYEIRNSQVGSVGRNTSVSNSNFSQQINDLGEDFDYSALSEQLDLLLTALKEKAKSAEEFISISEVVSAQDAAEKKNGEKIIRHLCNAGKWVLSTATGIGVNLVSEIMKSQMKL